MIPTRDELADAIAMAARKAFRSLFDEHPGHYYYCALVTSGEAHAPSVSAWSQEALDAAVAAEKDPEQVRAELKWSYADSPYCNYGEQYFSAVKDLFAQRPRLSPEMSDEDWAAEYQLRLEAMEAAMARLDSEAIFGGGAARLAKVILVEVAPPDSTNTARALRLNPREALSEWLVEAAEQ